MTIETIQYRDVESIREPPAHTYTHTATQRLIMILKALMESK